MSFFEGKISTTTWSATQQPVEKSDLDFKSEITDTTNQTSQGFQSNLSGIGAVDGSMDGLYNGSLGLTPGGMTTITFATGGGGPSFGLPMRIPSVRLSTQTRNGVYRFAAQMTSNGVLTYSL